MVEIADLSNKSLYGDLIISTKNWDLFLAPSQRYLGTSVLVLKRKCQNLRDLNENEWKEFTKLVKYIEIAMESLLKPDLFNWSCFKNKTFREGKPHPQIHWHIHPRYEKDIIFEGIKFHDPDFGFPPQTEKVEINKDIRIKLIDLIAKKLNNIGEGIFQ